MEFNISESARAFEAELNPSQVLSLRSILRYFESMPTGELEIQNADVKRSIARFVESLLDSISTDNEDIMAAAYCIMGWFGRYTYGDSLDDIVGISGELETPSHASGSPLELLGQMRHLIRRYLQSCKTN